eukprot:scaffold1307_cov200-Pinguiococcus_pyrenoidosus.AAC.125
MPHGKHRPASQAAGPPGSSRGLVHSPTFHLSPKALDLGDGRVDCLLVAEVLGGERLQQLGLASGALADQPTLQPRVHSILYGLRFRRQALHRRRVPSEAGKGACGRRSSSIDERHVCRREPALGSHSEPRSGGLRERRIAGRVTGSVRGIEALRPALPREDLRRRGRDSRRPRYSRNGAGPPDRVHVPRRLVWERAGTDHGGLARLEDANERLGARGQLRENLGGQLPDLVAPLLPRSLRARPHRARALLSMRLYEKS